MGCFVMKESFVTREACENDFQGIRQLSQSVALSDDDGYGENWYNFKSGSDLFKSFIVEEKGLVIGSCYLSIISNIARKGKYYAVIENIIVRPVSFGRDVRKALMEISIDYAKSCRCYKVMLLNNMHESHVVGLCRSLGFVGDSKVGFVLRFE